MGEIVYLSLCIMLITMLFKKQPMEN